MKIDKEILEKLALLPTPKIIGVSGFGGSGKSSFAKELGILTNAPVISIDSFQKNRTDDSYSLWDIMDFSRLEREVLMPFSRQEKKIIYGHFDWETNGIKVINEIENNGILIVEGVGLFRPELVKYFSYTIWIDCSMNESISRGKKRDREEYHNSQDDLWDGVWKTNDSQYYETYKPKESANLVISNS